MSAYLIDIFCNNLQTSRPLVGMASATRGACAIHVQLARRLCTSKSVASTAVRQVSSHNHSPIHHSRSAGGPCATAKHDTHRHAASAHHRHCSRYISARSLSTTLRSTASAHGNNDIYYMWHPSEDSTITDVLDLDNVAEPKPSLAQELSAFTERVSLKFADSDLLLMAVTHPSWSSVNNSRLVALGTNAIKSALAEYIFVRYPHLPGDCISDAVAGLTTDDMLFRAANNIGVMHLMRTNVRVHKNLYNPEARKVVSDGYAAIVGAVLVDQGTFTANEFVLDMMVPLLEYSGISNIVKLSNPKKTLSALLASEELDAAEYKVLRASGRASDAPVVVVGVYIGDKKLGEGAGFSTESAEMSAAKTALMTHYTEEVSDVVLPSSYGDFTVGDVVDYLAEPHPEDDEPQNP
eukprot:m.1258287 g.1258287  ORF g.1258287 m.1258287 type:complete len:408 (+) comp24718_c0_seq4:55-1278(+)